MQIEPVQVTEEPTTRGDKREKRFGGLLERQTSWRLSWRGRFLVLALMLAGALGILYGVYPFLSVNAPVPADLMVVEGWSPSYTMAQAAQEFQAGKYKRVLVVRAVLDLPDKYESGRFAGDYMSALLVQHGVPESCVTTIFPTVVKKDRTYHSALAVKEWIAQQKMTVKSLNLVTFGPHARRSRLMYEKAFGNEVRIGIIPMESIEYDPAHWWRTSEGVREVLGEIIAYLYARFLFHASS